MIIDSVIRREHTDHVWDVGRRFCRFWNPSGGIQYDYLGDKGTMDVIETNYLLYGAYYVH